VVMKKGETMRLKYKIRMIAGEVQKEKYLR
jgi:hypothetical protein